LLSSALVLGDKEAGLRTHYTATIVLLRDRLAADLSLPRDRRSRGR
jgi:hypothetical protein